MKWDTIKKQVAAEVHSVIMQARNLDTDAEILIDLVASNFEILRGLQLWELRKAYADKAAAVIDNWDVRAAEKLRDLFTGAFPRSLRKGRLVAEYDEKGDWVVFAAPPVANQHYTPCTPTP